MKQFNVHFFILFFISIMVAISDIIIYFAKTDFFVTNIISGILIIILFIILIKKNKISIKSDFSKYDLIFLIPFFIFMMFTIVFPDLSWDTRSYHIYLQENVFVDKINLDFFAGRNLNSFLFALGDRIFYLFRYILGYRLGTIFSYYVIVILFYQIKIFFQKFLENLKTSISAFFSLIICITSIVFSYVGTYYIDNLGLVFLVEIFSIALFENDVLKDKIKLYIMTTIIGLSIAIKVTNIIFLIGLGIFFIIHNFKELKYLKIYDYLICIVTMILPWVIYGVDNISQTGNPVFPYYNNVFKSQLFMENSWKDTNFGPENIIQFLIWPIYIVFNPKRAFDTKFVDFTWGIGFIFIVVNIIKSVLKKDIKDNKLFILSIIIFINYYLWEKLLIGYVRYATILLILSLIITILMINDIFSKNKKVGIILFGVVVIMSIPSLIFNVLINVKEYNTVSDFVFEYKLNIGNIIKDRKNTKFIKNDVILGAIGDDSLLPTMLREKNNIYNLEEWVTITNDTTRKLYEEKINDEIIYVPVDEKTKERKEEYLNKNSFEILNITELEGKYNFLSPSNKLYLYEVCKQK